MFTMQHYKVIAGIISQERRNAPKNFDTPGQVVIAESTLDDLVDNLCKSFKQDNPNFNSIKFRAAAE